MTMIRPDGQYNWEFLNFDKFLRNKDAPALYDDPITHRDIRGGAEVVSRGGNIMARAITRDKLAPDSLLVSMNLNADAGEVVHVATGYDRSLNDYIFAVTWDGTNYYLRRFNTADLLSPYQDAYSVNLPVDSKRNQVLSLAVTEDRVSVLIRNNEGVKIYRYTFDLTYQDALDARPFGFFNKEFVRNLTFDGKYYVHSVPSDAYFLTRRLAADTTIQISGDIGNTSTRQGFTTPADGGNIKRVSFLIAGFPGLGTSWGSVYLMSSGDVPITSVNVNISVADNAPAEWLNKDVDWSVSANTAYRISPRGGGGGSPKIAVKNSNDYAGGYFIESGVDGGETSKDASFAIYQALPSGWGGKIMRFDPATFALVDSFAWPGAYTQPTELLAYDGKFYYGYNPATKTITKFAIVDGAIAVASEQVIQESVYGMLHFNNFIYVVYSIGTSIVAVPVSI